MKKSILIKITILLLGGGCIIAALSSCENFLKAHEVKEQIEEAIEIANSNPITYFVTAQEGSGTVTPDQVRVKKKESFDLRFKPASDWKFICWEVINTTTGQVEENSIKFENPDQTETKAYVINPKEGLEIHAKCIQIPCVVDIEPKGTGYANSPIIIKFNIPMEAPEVTADDDSLFNYDNLLLTYGDKKVSDYFEAPVFNEAKTELKLVPNWQDLMAFIKKENVGSALIEISFTDKITVNQNGVELPVDTKGLTYSVNYIPVVETTPPVQYDYFVTRKQMTLESAQTITAGEKFHFESVADQGSLTNEQFGELLFQNATNGTVYIYGRFYDENSGVQSVVVTHRRTQEKDGTNVGEQEWKTVYTRGSPGTEFITQNKETRFCIMHKLDNGKNGDSADGAYILNVEVKDACENTALAYDKTDTSKNRKTVTAIKKSGFYGSDGSGFIGTGLSHMESVINGNTFNESNYDKLLKHLWYYMISENEADDTQALFGKDNDIFYLPDTFTIECEYIDKSGKPAKDKFILNEQSAVVEPEWNLELDVDSVSDLELLVRVTDILGNVDERTYKFPPKDNNIIIEMTKNNNTIKIENLFRSQSGGSITDWWIIDSDNKIVSTKNNKQFTYNPQKSYSIIQKQGDLYSEKTSIDFSSEVGSNVNKVQINEPCLEKASKKGVLNCIVPLNMESDPWSYYDLIKVDYGTGTDYLNKTSLYITKGNSFISFSFTDHAIYQTYSSARSKWIKVYGLRNHVWSEAQEKTINLIQESQEPVSPFMSLDNSSPFISLDYTAGNVVFRIFEYETGIESASLKLLNGKNNGKGEELQFDANYRCEIPTYKLMPVSTEPVTFEYEISDKAGNKISGVDNYFKESYPKEYDSITILEPETLDGSVRIRETTSIFSDFYPDLYAFAYDETNHSFSVSLDNGTELNRSGVTGDFQFDHQEEYTIAISELNKVFSTYVKIVPRDTGGTVSWFTPFYCYNGAPGTGENDFLMQNENSSDSVVISSDKPVFVHTLVSEMPYEVCKKWDYSEWEYYKLSLNEKILDFGKPTNEDPNKNLPKRYVIPVSDNQIKSGDCYVVIAHFSDNHVEMSRVMVK